MSWSSVMHIHNTTQICLGQSRSMYKWSSMFIWIKMWFMILQPYILVLLHLFISSVSYSYSFFSLVTFPSKTILHPDLKGASEGKMLYNWHTEQLCISSLFVQAFISAHCALYKLLNALQTKAKTKTHGPYSYLFLKNIIWFFFLGFHT